MSDLLNYLLYHLHGATIHFPIALLVVSVLLDVAALRWSQVRSSAWLALIVGALMTIPATITGLIAHLPYEDTPQLEYIEIHQYLAFATTALFVALGAWRWRSLRRGDDVGKTRLYLGLAVVGLVVLSVTGYLGGNLVYQHGVGVQGMTR